MSEPNWNDLERPQAAAPKADDRFAELCSTVFSSGAGRELLALLRTRTIEHRTSPIAPEAVLRTDEAVRGFVASLERARDRGSEALKAKAKPALNP